MEVLDIRPMFMQSTHAQDATGICNLCETTFPYASTGTNTCLKCLTTQTDITSGITKQAVLTFCGTCKRFFGPPWTRAELGSKELLSFCLRRVKGLAGVKIIDASFIWTEPNSHRLRLKLTIQKEVIKNVMVQQTFMIDYVLHDQQCEDCKAEYASDTWGALVQVRQKSEQRKNIFLIEQLILKYNAHGNVLKIKNTSEGVEFFYKDKAGAMRLVDFLQSTFLMKVKQSKQLISQDSDNSSNYKSVFSVDLPRICKDDLIILTPRLAAAMGGCSCVLICSRVTTTIQFFDPINVQTIEMNSLKFFQYEDEMILVPAKDNLSEFLVFDSETCNTPNSEPTSSKAKEGLLRVVRKTDCKEFEVRTHLADILKEGNWVFGYDLSLLGSKGCFDNVAEANTLPEILLVKKSYAEVINKKNRIWRLKRLDKEDNEANVVSAHKIQESTDYEEFLNDLETDPEARLNVNLYRDEKAIKNTDRNKMDDENASETSRKNHKKQIKRKLKVRRRSQRSPKAATGGQDRNGRENNDDDMQEEKRDDDDSDDNESDAKEKEEEEEEENDPMVKIEELLADLTLEDQEYEEEENDAIEEFIRRLERVRIEGKE